MADVGPLPELAWLPIDRLDIDPAYQRRLGTPKGQKLIQKIAEEFSWLKFTAILATRGESDDKGPRWVLIDGQHRTAGARRRGDIPHLPSVVFANVTLAEQAASFVGANRDRVPVSTQAILNARLLAGDSDALTLKRLCDDAGIELLRYYIGADYAPIGTSAAIPAFTTALKLYGEESTGAALKIMKEVCGHVRGGLRGEYCLAIASWFHRGGDQAGFADRLKGFGGKNWLANAAGTGGTNQRAKNIRTAFARVFTSNPVFGLRPPSPPTTPPPLRYPRTLLPVTPALTSGGSPPRSPPAVAKSPPRPKPGPSKPPHTAAPQPAAPTARSPDDEAIADFLRTKGATPVMSLEQVAVYLRKKGRDASVRLSDDGEHWASAPICHLGGRVVSIEEFYAAANSYRKLADLPPLVAPRSGPGWSLDEDGNFRSRLRRQKKNAPGGPERFSS